MTDSLQERPTPRRIGNYDVLNHVADGGFATLYMGRHPLLKRLVAIKVCSATDPQLRRQFLIEAEIAGKLDHKNIVRTFDSGFETVGPYLVQEYLHGEDLADKVARGADLGVGHRLAILMEVAEGLAYSHAQGVYHLDIKPANVRISRSGRAKILDFGIARLASHDGAPTGMVGTPGYVPPEQVRGEKLDASADVFGFGVLAYELLTYHRPFDGTTVGALLKQVLETTPPALKHYWPECPASLAQVIDGCLEKDRRHRYGSFDELLPELEAVVRDLTEQSEDAGSTMLALERLSLIHRLLTGREATSSGAFDPADADGDSPDDGDASATERGSRSDLALGKS